jgi:hypothetical protein
MLPITSQRGMNNLPSYMSIYPYCTLMPHPSFYPSLLGLVLFRDSFLARRDQLFPVLPVSTQLFRLTTTPHGKTYCNCIGAGA